MRRNSPISDMSSAICVVAAALPTISGQRLPRCEAPFRREGRYASQIKLLVTGASGLVGLPAIDVTNIVYTAIGWIRLPDCNGWVLRAGSPLGDELTGVLRSHGIDPRALRFPRIRRRSAR